MNAHISATSIEDKVSSEIWNLVNDPLPSNHYDLVYLNGIVQHFSHVGLGLRNCMQAVKKDGYLWRYFYRSGSFYGFIVELVRDLVAEFRENDREHFINMVLADSDTGAMNGRTSAAMDNLYVT